MIIQTEMKAFKIKLFSFLSNTLSIGVNKIMTHITKRFINFQTKRTSQMNNQQVI